MSRPIIGRRQLERIRARLSDRDIGALTALATHRFLTTRQICRLHFLGKAAQAPAMRAANRALLRLAEFELIDSLERRIGGVRAGSGAYVWGLTAAGGRLLQMTGALDIDGLPKRVRDYEPSPTFLEHTLAVAEISIRLVEAERRGEFTLLAVQHEPASWRAYTGSGGGTLHLKPDLAVVTATDEYEDHWFFEVDLATEPPSRIIRACLTYEEYRRSGAEQRRLGLFPAVVWIVPTTRRKETIATHLRQHAAVSGGLFHVITLDELGPLLVAGPVQAVTGNDNDA